MDENNTQINNINTEPNFEPVNTVSNTEDHTDKKLSKRKIIFILVAVFVVFVVTYFFVKYNALKEEEGGRPITNEERLEMLGKLDVTPEGQKSNELTVEEKNKFIDSIPDAGVYTKKDIKSKEEIANILNATN